MYEYQDLDPNPSVSANSHQSYENPSFTGEGNEKITTDDNKVNNTFNGDVDSDMKKVNGPRFTNVLEITAAPRSSNENGDLGEVTFELKPSSNINNDTTTTCASSLPPSGSRPNTVVPSGDVDYTAALDDHPNKIPDDRPTKAVNSAVDEIAPAIYALPDPENNNPAAITTDTNTPKLKSEPIEIADDDTTTPNDVSHKTPTRRVFGRSSYRKPRGTPGSFASAVSINGQGAGAYNKSASETPSTNATPVATTTSSQSPPSGAGNTAFVPDENDIETGANRPDATPTSHSRPSPGTGNQQPKQLYPTRPGLLASIRNQQLTTKLKIWYIFLICCAVLLTILLVVAFIKSVGG